MEKLTKIISIILILMPIVYGLLYVIIGYSIGDERTIVAVLIGCVGVVVYAVNKY